MRIRSIAQIVSELGESPIYDQTREILVWTDITGLKWHKHSLGSGETISQETGGMIGAIAFRESKGYVAAVKEGFATLYDNESYVVTNKILDENQRMNDGKCDALGRFWAGSANLDFEEAKGKLFRLDTDFRCEMFLDGLTLPNGMDWSPDSKYFYLIDSLKYKLWKFDFDLEYGIISNKVVLYEFNRLDGIPDGLSVSSEGDILVAMYGGYSIQIISADGKLKQKVILPIENPTSCTFVGRKFESLIVTSASSERGDHHNLNGHTLLFENFGMSGKSSQHFGG
jgi:sugar lactone lactonase YvrE